MIFIIQIRVLMKTKILIQKNVKKGIFPLPYYFPQKGLLEKLEQEFYKMGEWKSFNYKEIKKRFNSFDEDVKHWKDYDYILINKNLDVCFRQIENIILGKKKQLSNSSQIVQ